MSKKYKTYYKWYAAYKAANKAEKAQLEKDYPIYASELPKNYRPEFTIWQTSNWPY